MSGSEKPTTFPRSSKIILLATMVMLGDNFSPITMLMISEKGRKDKIMSSKYLKTAESEGGSKRERER